MTSTHHGKTNNTKALCQGIVNILNKKKISLSFLQPVGRLSKQNPEKTPVPTMLILAKRGELDETWLQTTREVHAYLFEKGIQDMAVELADPAAFQPLLTSTIKHSDKVFHWWEKVLAEILKFLDPKEVNMVGCHRRGRDTNGADNFPTVVVVVDPKIDKSWKATRERIIAILDSYQLSMVGVEIIKGTVERAAKSQVGLRRSHIQGPAQFGVSLGLEGLAHSSSTFGGFVELKRPDTGVWVTFGLTCYHCVVPPWEKRTDPSESHHYRTWDAHGIKPGDLKASQILLLHHPSLEDLENQLTDLIDDEKSKMSNAQYKKWCMLVNSGHLNALSGRDQSTWKRFIKNIGATHSFRTELERFLSRGSYKFGSVFAASGYKNVPSNTMKNPPYATIRDWALVNVSKKRLGRNKVSFKELLMHSGIANIYEIHGDLELRESKTVNLSNTLHIRGRTTGDSRGFYNGLKTALVAEEVKPDGSRVKVFTTEHCIVGKGGKEFSALGDSGSLVWNDENAMVGLLFAGCAETRTSYFTHKADLFADILSMTGAKGVRVLE